MREPDKQDRGMMWMGAAMVMYFVVPTFVALFLGGGLDVFIGHDSRSIPADRFSRGEDLPKTSQLESQE
jgi:sulfite exporter TauE/SafE